MTDRATPRMATKRPTAVSFFSGAGGMDAGFSMAGFDVRLAVEIDPSCCDTLRKNLPETKVLNEDINRLSPEEICQASGLEVGNIDCIFGGPPCQSFSLAGRREGLNDERGLLVFRFIELVRALRPRMFVMENVKGMANWNGGYVLDEIERRFKEPLASGDVYKVQHKILNAASYGVPQSRERIFIVGSRLKRDFRFPEATHGLTKTGDLRPFVTVGDALLHLPPADEPSEAAARVSRSIKGRILKHGY